MGSGPGIYIILLEGYSVHLLLPYLIGFVGGYFLISPLLAQKKRKIYIKSKTKRLIVSILIALICGGISYIILGTLIEIISGNGHLRNF
jgi:hypothetical protein